MPTTLANAAHVVDLFFEPGCMLQRPALVPLIMQVVDLWAHTEATFVGLVANLLKTEPVAATALLQAIDNQTAQRAAIIGAAAAVLKEDDLALFESAFLSTAASRRVRHKFAHHLWGVSPQVPDSLLLVDPKDYNTTTAEWNQILTNAQKSGGTYLILPKARDLLRPSIYVWSESDLLEEVGSAKRAFDITRNLAVMAFINFSGSADAIRQRLSADPLIHARIQERRRKSSPKPA